MTAIAMTAIARRAIRLKRKKQPTASRQRKKLRRRLSNFNATRPLAGHILARIYRSSQHRKKTIMVKVKAPALSLEASGSLGGALVFSKWKGRPYVRTLVRPSNPRSGGQVGVRSMFKFLAQEWAELGETPQNSWEDRADITQISPFNAYMGYNQFRWRDFTAPSQTDPAASAMTPATMGVITATAGVRSITISAIVTTPADMWGLMVFRDLETAFNTAFDNLIGIIPYVATSPITLVDSPLEPDEYFYNFREFTKDGQISAEVGEENATVT